MKTGKMWTILVLLLGLVLCRAEVSEAGPMRTAFTYQGHLYDSNRVANGQYDLQFKLYDADVDGNQVGIDVNKPDVDVIDGYFGVEVDFGSGVFDGGAAWLELGVRPGDQDDPNVYTALSPRQVVTATPYALQSRGLFVTDSGDTWTAKELSRGWTSVAISADGILQTAVVWGGRIYVSTDSGDSWEARESDRNWYSVAMSADGTTQTAVAWLGRIYVSTDSGDTWVAKDSNRNWYSVAMSADGTKQTAVVWGGQIYVSTNSGNSWAAKESNRDWRSVAMSAEGTIQTAAVTDGQIYVSTDSGSTWTAKDTNREWVSVAMSADGTVQTAVVAGGQIYVSTDSGDTWAAKESDRDWQSVAMSADGTKQTAVVAGGQVYVSRDSGNSWNTKESGRDWEAVAMSADGTVQTAVVSGGQVYVSCDGFVGVGTMSPTEELEVNGTVKATAFVGDGSGLTIVETDPEVGAVDSNYVPRWDGSALVTGTIYDDGNSVGIGTTSPAGMLDVNGPIYQRGGELHADYVFEADYELESIDEHSEYMWEQKHLPAIPQTERDEKGQEIIEVGGHRRGIVEELEKAHIYIEQLHKRIGELQEQNGRMEGRLAKLEAMIGESAEGWEGEGQ